MVGKVAVAVAVAVDEAAEVEAAAVVDPVSLVSSFLGINCFIPSDPSIFAIFFIVFIPKRLITSLLLSS